MSSTPKGQRPLLRIGGPAIALIQVWGTGAASDEAPVVNVYDWADCMGPTTLADFEPETGIAVNYDTYDSSEIVEAKLLAGSTGYDVILHGAQYPSRLTPSGCSGAWTARGSSRLPNPESNQAADPVLDDDSLAVALPESLRLLVSAQTPERLRLLGDGQDACCRTTLRALGA